MNFKLFIAAMVMYIAASVFSYSQTYSIFGAITEDKSGENMIGVGIGAYPLKDSSRKSVNGAVSNKFGFYSIPKLKSGIYIIRAHGVGYEDFADTVNLSGDIRLNIKMKLKDIKTQEVLVTADREASGKLSESKLKPDFIFKMPSLGGEADVFKTLQLLPGVKQGSEISSGLYVRGSSPDQNLTLLDGVIVYNPSHLGGFLSSFNSDALRDVRLIKGAFPAEYGGRLASVIDMTMKEGNKEKLSGSGGISMISSRLTLEGPIGEDLTFMISGRRMYLDLLISLAPDSDEAPDYYFYDLNAKINYKISDNDRLFISGFFCRDVLASPDKKEKFDLFWGNQTGNLRWMHVFSPALFSNLSLIYTNYNFNVEISDDEKKNSSNWNSKSKIEDITLRFETQYFPLQNHVFKSGIDFTSHVFNANADGAFDYFDQEFNRSENKDLRNFDLALYFQDEWKISDKWNSNLGARAYYFSEGSYFSFEPRASIGYNFNENTSFSFGNSLCNQFLHMVTRNDIPLPTDVWYPSNSSIKPSKSFQSALGFEHVFADGEYLFSAEVYYKYMWDLLEYKENADFSFGAPLAEQFTSGTGQAYGLELFLNKRIGNLNGWIGYTLSWTKRKFEELNHGKEFYPRYDRRHDVSVALVYELSKSWELGATWSFGTGQAYTMPNASYSFKPYDPDGYSWEDEKYLFTEKNGFRLPAFHKLDLNFMYKFQWFNLPFQLSLNVYNAYNRKNPFFWYISDEWDDVANKNNKVIKQVTLFPIIPTLGLSFKF
jgi:outer membrane cobalamin receptor